MAKQVTAAQSDSDALPESTSAQPSQEKGADAASEAKDGRRRDQTVIEVAIERALDDVRAEIEATAAEVAEAEAEKADDSRTVAGGGDVSAVGPADLPSAAEDGQADATTATDTGSPPAAALPADQASEADVAPASSPSADQPPSAEAPSGDAAPSESEEQEAVPAIQPLTQMLARVTPPASMKDLEEAMTSAGGPPIGQMVEDMIRPIVREWLANNLPSMVERIIREEIERVSRSNG